MFGILKLFSMIKNAKMVIYIVGALGALLTAFLKYKSSINNKVKQKIIEKEYKLQQEREQNIRENEQEQFDNYNELKEKQEELDEQQKVNTEETINDLNEVYGIEDLEKKESKLTSMFNSIKKK